MDEKQRAMKHILTILGNRPQFIKAAPVSRLLAGDPRVKETIVHTGQHFDPQMSGVFFDDLGIPTPAVNLNINGLGHGAMVGQMMEALEVQMEFHRPDIVLVYGDTDSTLAGALAAAKLNIPVAHVEAGVRSGDMTMPEELNRTVVDSVSSLLFCVHQNHADALRMRQWPRSTNARPVHIVVTGDVMLDTFLMCPHMIKPDADIPKDFILATVHRKGNLNRVELGAIVGHLSVACKPVVIPLHPATRAKMNEYGFEFSPNVTVIDPVGYLEMLWLLHRCAMVATDSGGLQREAYYARKNCLLLRDRSEWNELVLEGASFHVRDGYNLTRSPQRLIPDLADFEGGIYGNGTAAHHIVKELIAY
jgi:UDP-GlcNAc3NAcA epimerase